MTVINIEVEIDIV